MLRIDVQKARPGMKLALAVQNPQAPSQVLLKIGFELTPQIIRRLMEYRIRHIWVRYPSLSYLERYIDADAVRSQTQVVTQITNTFEKLQKQSSAKLDYDEYTEALQQLVNYISTHPQSAVFLGDLADSSDDLMRHSAAVTYLSLLMGMKLEDYLVRERRHVEPGRAKEVTNLGLGAMLHDVGVTQLDPAVRRRFNQTGDEGDVQWQEHPALGFRLVRGQVDPSAATCVLNHHQRYDGTGYAGEEYPALAEKRIHVFARIVAVADHFDRLRSPANLPPQPTVWVLNAMLTEPLHSKFDPEALKALLAVVPPYPPGSLVRLSDGQHAVVIDHHPQDPCRPTVQIIPDPVALVEVTDPPAGPTIDLSTQQDRLSIVEHEGHDVRPFNFGPPDLAKGLTHEYAWT
ncbi:MAG: HD-GYP domain-containing protein [Phycisphaeraceae bacterium]